MQTDARQSLVTGAPKVRSREAKAAGGVEGKVERGNKKRGVNNQEGAIRISVSKVGRVPSSQWSR